MNVMDQCVVNELMREVNCIANNPTVLNIEKFSNLREVYHITNLVVKSFRSWKLNTENLSETSKQSPPFSVEKHYVIAAQRSAYPFVYECLLRRPTQEHFQVARKFINDLSIVLDDDGIMRSLGRLGNAVDSNVADSPIILPPKSHLCDSIVRQAHERCLHGGTGDTLTHLRRRFWIPKGRQVVKSITS